MLFNNYIVVIFLPAFSQVQGSAIRCLSHTCYHLLLHGSNHHSVGAHPLPYLTFFQEDGKIIVLLV